MIPGFSVLCHLTHLKAKTVEIAFCINPHHLSNFISTSGKAPVIVSMLQQKYAGLHNCNFLYRNCCAHKTFLVLCLCTLEIQKCTLIMIRYSHRKCIKLVLNPFAAKNGLPISILCTAPFLQTILFQST